MNGEAEERVSTFLSTEPKLSDYKLLIESYQSTITEILAYHDTVWFDMFQLDCSDIKHGLCTVAGGFVTRLVQTLAHKHVEDNERICSEYEEFRAKALKDPDDSREMMDLINYMQDARGGMVVDLQRDVQDSLKRLAYLLDVHTFSTEEMNLNQTTLLWPQGIAPVFEENEKVCVRVTV